MILNKATQVWGVQSQFTKLIEELAELISAVAKYQVKDVENRHKEVDLVNRIVDEVADCEILIEQLKIILKIHKKVEKQKEIKLLRLYDILENSF